MKCVFVRYTEERPPEQGGRLTCVVLAKGEAAESRETFTKTHGDGVPITIMTWFEVPPQWKNAVTDGAPLNDAFSAVLGLDVLSDSPVVSDLLATIFEAGFKAGRRHDADVQAAFRRGWASSGTATATR